MAISLSCVCHGKHGGHKLGEFAPTRVFNDTPATIKAELQLLNHNCYGEERKEDKEKEALLRRTNVVDTRRNKAVCRKESQDSGR